MAFFLISTIHLYDKIHEGQQYRKLEDKEDRDHFGPPSDPLMPQAHNMATNIGRQLWQLI